MSKQPRAIELADQLKERFGATVPTSQAAAELRRLHAANAELAEALTFYADPTRYHGPMLPLIEPDKWSDDAGLHAYRLDVTRDGGVIARAALSKHKEQK